MNNRYLEVTFRKGRPLAAYLHLPRRDGDRSVRVEQFPAGLVVDLAADGRPIGIEITAPAAVSLDQINSVLRGYGLEELPDEDLMPLREVA